LPSSEPDIEFRNQYHSALEPGLFSVSGGVLRGDSMPSGSKDLSWGDVKSLFR